MRRISLAAAIVFLVGACESWLEATPDYLRDETLAGVRLEARRSLAAITSNGTPGGECTLASGTDTVVAAQMSFASFCGIRDEDGIPCGGGSQAGATVLISPSVPAAANGLAAGVLFVRPTGLDSDCEQPHFVFQTAFQEQPGIVSLEDMLDAVRDVPLEEAAPLTYNDFWQPEVEGQDE